MSKLNFQSNLIAEPTKSNNVKKRNTTLCIAEKRVIICYLQI